MTDMKKVTTFTNLTYPTNTSAPEWSVTWKYSAGPESQPVWAYPNIMVDDILPVALSDITTLEFDLLWSYTVGNTTSKTTDLTALDEVSLNCNVAIDMFLDANSTKSSNSSSAEYEIMVWFAHLGDSTYAIGNTTRGIINTYDLNGTELYVLPVLTQTVNG
jgi:Glycosyl hydrolase family 12